MLFRRDVVLEYEITLIEFRFFKMFSSHTLNVLRIRFLLDGWHCP